MFTILVKIINTVYYKISRNQFKNNTMQILLLFFQVHIFFQEFLLKKFYIVYILLTTYNGESVNYRNFNDVIETSIFHSGIAHAHVNKDAPLHVAGSSEMLFVGIGWPWRLSCTHESKHVTGVSVIIAFPPPHKWWAVVRPPRPGYRDISEGRFCKAHDTYPNSISEIIILFSFITNYLHVPSFYVPITM